MNLIICISLFPFFFSLCSLSFFSFIISFRFIYFFLFPLLFYILFFSSFFSPFLTTYHFLSFHNTARKTLSPNSSSRTINTSMDGSDNTLRQSSLSNCISITWTKLFQQIKMLYFFSFILSPSLFHYSFFFFS